MDTSHSDPAKAAHQQSTPQTQKRVCATQAGPVLDLAKLASEAGRSASVTLPRLPFRATQGARP